MAHGTGTQNCVKVCQQLAIHVLHVSGELGDIVKMSNLTWRVLVGIGGKCKRERFAVGKQVELPTFDEVAEVLDSEVPCTDRLVTASERRLRIMSTSRLYQRIKSATKIGVATFVRIKTHRND